MVFQLASQPKTVAEAVAITSSLRPPPVTSYWTPVTPLEAPASRFCEPDTVAPLDGMTTLVLGGASMTSRVSCLVAVWAGVDISVAFTVKENVPHAVGTPLINPYELRVRPAGRAPPESDQL